MQIIFKQTYFTNRPIKIEFKPYILSLKIDQVSRAVNNNNNNNNKPK